MKIDKLNLPIFLFTIAFFLEGLDAFSIFNIPLSWIGVVIYVLIFVYLKISGTRGYVFDLTLIKYFLYYLTLVTIIRASTFEANMPEYATTSFIEFISLRILKIISFYSIVSLNPKRRYRSSMLYFSWSKFTFFIRLNLVNKICSSIPIKKFFCFETLN